MGICYRHVFKKHTEACVSSVSEKCCCVKEAHVPSSEKLNLAKEDRLKKTAMTAVSFCFK